MKSKAVPSFWDGYRKLPENVRQRARRQYLLWLEDPRHPSLHFKKAGEFWSVRVTGSYRAVGIMDQGTVVWFFIGTHAEYDRLLS